MGSSYSDLKIYLLCKGGTYGIPKNKQTKDQNPKTEENQKYFVTVKEENYDKCVNFEKVTHSITFGKSVDPLYYNVLLYDGNEKDKGKNVFGYYYPSTNNEVLKELHVYYSVLAPDSPLVVSFVTRGDQTHNFLYSGLLSTVWVRAYSIAYYSLGKDVSSELLTKEFRKSHRNRKIKFEICKNVVDVSGFKQDIENNKVYRYIYYPTGDKSVLGSECLCKFDSENAKPLNCPKSTESAKPAETPKPAAPSTPANATSTPNYDNKIDPYYLDFVNGHYYDGVIFYFVKNGSQGQNPASGNNGVVSSTVNSQSGSNGGGESQKDNYDKNMAVLLELIDKCEPKTHFQRKDKHGNWWSQGDFKYKDDKELIDKLKEYQKSAEANDSTTFILERTSGYKGVSKVYSNKDKNTYSKYTHSATASNKPNFLFRKSVTKIGKYDPDKDKTKSIDVYFLKIGDKEEDWPFIIMITNEDEKATGASSAGSSQPPAAPQQQPQQQQPQQPASGGGGAASTQKECKKCYFSSENYDFKDWQELTVDKKEDKADEKKKEKTPKQTEDPGKQLEEKLEAKLAKIEEYGKCTKDINILRSIAYQVLTGKDDPDTKRAAKPEPVEGRPDLKIFKEKIYGTSLKVVLGSVAAGLVVLGIISAIIYGIYWYNTTIKLLT